MKKILITFAIVVTVPIIIYLLYKHKLTYIQERHHILEKSTICLRGVEYYIIGDKKTPAFKRDGSLYLCENEKL